MKQISTLVLAASLASCGNSGNGKVSADSGTVEIKVDVPGTLDSIGAKGNRVLDSVESKGGKLMDGTRMEGGRLLERVGKKLQERPAKDSSK